MKIAVRFRLALFACSCSFCASSSGQHKTDCPQSDVGASARTGEEKQPALRSAINERERSALADTRRQPMRSAAAGAPTSGHSVQHDSARALSDAERAAEDLVRVSNSVLDRIAAAMKATVLSITPCVLRCPLCAVMPWPTIAYLSHSHLRFRTVAAVRFPFLALRRRRSGMRRCST